MKGIYPTELQLAPDSTHKEIKWFVSLFEDIGVRVYSGDLPHLHASEQAAVVSNTATHRLVFRHSDEDEWTELIVRLKYDEKSRIFHMLNAYSIRDGATEQKSKGWLGVGLNTVKNEEAQEYGFHRDIVVVRSVQVDSPAEQAGFEKGDIFLRVDDVDLLSQRQLVFMMRRTAPGTEVSFLLMRDGVQIEKEVHLGVHPDPVSYLTDRFLGTPAPTFQVVLLESDEERSLQEYRGQILLLEFWATWCGPCVASIPDLNKLNARFDDELVIIAITDEAPEIIDSFRRSKDIDYSVAVDTTGATKGAYGIGAIPTSFLIDHHGIVREVRVGKMDYRSLEKQVERIVEERRASL